MNLLATNLLKLSEDNKTDYYKKYKEHLKENCNSEIIEVESLTDYIEESPIITNLNNNEYLINKLKNYRLEQSHIENVKAYYIFTNKMLDALIEKKPRTIEELHNLSGFGDVKISKYGQSIINIFKDYLD